MNNIYKEKTKVKLSGTIHAITTSSDGNIYTNDSDNVAIITTDGSVSVFDVGHLDCIRCISLSLDEKIILTASHDGSSKLIDVSSRGVIRTFIHNPKMAVFCAIFGKCATDIYTCSGDTTIKKWDATNGECMQTFIGHIAGVAFLLYDKLKHRLFSSSYDSSIICWNLDTGDRISTLFGHTAPVYSLTWLNSFTVASSSSDKTVKLWDSTSGIILQTLNSHTNHVFSVAAAGDAIHLITSGADGSVKVWNVLTGECLQSLTHHSDFVWKVAVSVNGNNIISGGVDRMLHILEVTPPFAILLKEGYLTPIAINNTYTEHSKLFRLYTNGMIRMFQGECYHLITTVNPTTLFKTINDTRFEIASSDNNNNSSDIFTFETENITQSREWHEWIAIVRSQLLLSTGERSNNPTTMLTRFRFDFLQLIRFKIGIYGLYIPKSIMELIASLTSL